MCMHVCMCVHVCVQKLAMDTHGQCLQAVLLSVVFQVLLQAAVHVGAYCPHVSHGGQTPAAQMSGLSGLPVGGLGPQRQTELSWASSCSIHL